jgi:hypothetical protein
MWAELFRVGIAAIVSCVVRRLHFGLDNRFDFATGNKPRPSGGQPDEKHAYSWE